jgi:hypothetical protein
MNTPTVPFVRAAISTCFLLFLLVASSIAGAAGTRNPHVNADAATAALTLSPQENGLFRVLVTLNADFRPEGTLSPGAHAVQRKGIRSAQQTLLSRLAGKQHKVIAAYDVFPVIAMEVDAATLAYLQSAPEVRSVREDILLSPSDLESGATLHAQVPLSLGYDGNGWAVAIIDSGVQTNHPFLVGKVIAEACFSTTDAGLSSFSLCPNGQSTSGATPGMAGSGAGVNCDVAQFNDCKHGTHLAGIAVGADYPGGPGYNGIAPGAKLIAIQVFSRFTTSGQCGLAPAPCVRRADFRRDRGAPVRLHDHSPDVHQHRVGQPQRRRRGQPVHLRRQSDETGNRYAGFGEHRDDRRRRQLRFDGARRTRVRLDRGQRGFDQRRRRAGRLFEPRVVHEPAGAGCHDQFGGAHQFVREFRRHLRIGGRGRRRLGAGQAAASSLFRIRRP